MFLCQNFIVIFCFFVSLSCCSSQQEIDLGDNSVLIVGAGVAGLSAADKLISNGIKNILVIEAQDRLGGRIHTIPFGIKHKNLKKNYD